ncbi:MAG: hypothetical protein U9Q70_01280, partial [Chloroflexota bacterium]|nr:hypothetical protein [Chloroflexota bacterium]
MIFPALLLALAVGLAVYALLPHRDARAAMRKVLGGGHGSRLLSARAQARSWVREIFPPLSTWLYWEQVQGRWTEHTEETLLLVQAGLG